MIGSSPNLRATSVRYRQPGRSFHGSEIRAWRMPFAAMRSMNSSYMQGGSKPKVLTRPAISRIGVSGHSAQTRLMRSHGSSRSSRTAFLMCEPESNSIARKPASFRFFAIGSIMPVDIRSAHRLWWPSRMVVSTKRISSMCDSSLAFRRAVRPQQEQRLAEFDEVAIGDQYPLDHAGGFGLDAGEHFHHFDQSDGGARGHLAANLHIGRVRRGCRRVKLAYHRRGHRNQAIRGSRRLGFGGGL